jgi:hypothetical protein
MIIIKTNSVSVIMTQENKIRDKFHDNSVNRTQANLFKLTTIQGVIKKFGE